MTDEETTFGPNAWLVDEMYEQYRADPNSVSESWRDFFGDERDGEKAQKPPTQTATETAQEPKPVPKEPEPKVEPKEATEHGEPIRGAAARIVQNMEASLAVPTATSVRTVPARLLEVNRKVLNGYMGRTGQGKVSFTHLIGYAVVKAVATVPNMNSTFARDGDQPEVVRHDHVGLGIAVDVEKKDGSRTLLVPCIKNADTLDFKSFWAAYEELIRKVRSNKLSPDDFSGTTMSLTNPGTIGTVQSVPRLMPGQAVIVGVGSLDYPAEYQGADKRVIADLGLSKVLTLTSTYDHRVIQGAESGLFLQRINDLLLGADNFYEDVFGAMGVPYEPVHWRNDVNPIDNERLKAEEQGYILDRLNAAEAFERFLHTKYVGHKRFGLEGAESAIPLIDELLDLAAQEGTQEAVLGMAHRGRLNVLANIVGKSYRQIFREFEGDIDPDTIQGSGDVKYHVGASGKFVGRSGRELPLTLASNPSHLEAVDPVVEGMTRAKQDLLNEREAFPVLALLIHGDAAFAGQGVVAETLNLSALPGYRVGGTVHLVINNQLGFTTGPEQARSSVYPTDVAKMVQAPIFHVNGDDPEACVRVARLAFGFRQQFHKDVVIDLVG